MSRSLRPLSPDDIDNVLELARAVAEADDIDSVPTREWIEAQFTMPGIDITRMAWVLPGPSGGIQASVSAIPLCSDDAETIHISLEVHPASRGHGLEEELLRYAEEHGAAARTRPDLPGRFHVGIKAGQTHRAELLEGMGYQAVRWFLKLRMPLEPPPVAMPVPPGFTVQTVDDDLYPVYLALDESFRDHWNQARFTLEQFGHMMAALRQDPTLVLLARTPDGAAAGACLASVPVERNAQRDVREGEVAVLGVRRPYRRQGLGQAMLTRAVEWIRAQGMSVATIDVDADSPTGAQRLYARVGFSERRRSVVYHKAVS